MHKVRFILAVLQLIWDIGAISRRVRDLIDVYTDRGYAPAGSDPITAADLQVNTPQADLTQLTMAQFNEGAGVLVDLLAFLNNTSTTVKDREVTLNKMRQDV